MWRRKGFHVEAYDLCRQSGSFIYSGYMAFVNFPEVTFTVLNSLRVDLTRKQDVTRFLNVLFLILSENTTAAERTIQLILFSTRISMARMDIGD